MYCFKNPPAGGGRSGWPALGRGILSRLDERSTPMAGSKRKNRIDKNSLSCYNENALQKRFCFLLA